MCRKTKDILFCVVSIIQYVCWMVEWIGWAEFHHYNYFYCHNRKIAIHTFCRLKCSENLTKFQWNKLNIIIILIFNQTIEWFQSCILCLLSLLFDCVWCVYVYQYVISKWNEMKCEKNNDRREEDDVKKNFLNFPNKNVLMCIPKKQIKFQLFVEQIKRDLENTLRTSSYHTLDSGCCLHELLHNCWHLCFTVKAQC